MSGMRSFGFHRNAWSAPLKILPLLGDGPNDTCLARSFVRTAFRGLPALSAESGLGYVANAGANTVSVFDATAQRFVDTIPVGSRPSAMVIAPAPGATRLPTVTVRPTRTPTATPTLTPDLCPRAIVLHPDHGAPAAEIDLTGSCDQLASRRYAQVTLVPYVGGLPQARGDASGAYRSTFFVPRGTRPGTYLVQVITGSVIGEAPFTVDAACTEVATGAMACVSTS